MKYLEGSIRRPEKSPENVVIFLVGNKYSVPCRFAGRIAELQILGEKFEVYVDYENTCEHEILPGNCKVSRKKEHFQESLE